MTHQKLALTAFLISIISCSANVTDQEARLAILDQSVDAGHGDAALSGTLSVGENCVVVTGSDGGETTMVWRRDQVVWSEALQAIQIVKGDSTGVSARNGDKVTVGGGSLKLSDAPDPSVWIDPPHESCPDDAFIVGEVTIQP
jgi:hypothetical protein